MAYVIRRFLLNIYRKLSHSTSVLRRWLFSPDSSFDYPEFTNAKVLIVLNSQSGLAPYWHEFVNGMPDPQIISGFVSAMSSFMQEVTGTSAKTWKTEFGDDVILLIEKGEWSIGVLAVSKATPDVTEKLQRIVNEFEQNFYVLRYADDLQGSAFKEFDHYVRRTLVLSELTEQTIIEVDQEWSKYIPRNELPSTVFRMTKFIQSLRTGMSIHDIVTEQDITLDEAKDLVSQAFWCRAVQVNLT